jgi:hypothetical protein
MPQTHQHEHNEAEASILPASRSSQCWKADVQLCCPAPLLIRASSLRLGGHHMGTLTADQGLLCSPIQGRPRPTGGRPGLPPLALVTGLAARKRHLVKADAMLVMLAPIYRPVVRTRVRLGYWAWPPGKPTTHPDPPDGGAAGTLRRAPRRRPHHRAGGGCPRRALPAGRRHQGLEPHAARAAVAARRLRSGPWRLCCSPPPRASGAVSR